MMLTRLVLAVASFVACVASAHAFSQPPRVDAGPDQVVLFPQQDVTLHGSATDPDGTIAAYLWTHEFGPSASLTGVNSPTLSVAGLAPGRHRFRLTARDNAGDQSSDDVLVFVTDASPGGAVSGELRRWHKVTVTFQGPQTSEGAATNPYSDYALTVQFVHPQSGTSLQVPGYYAADGNAANSSATSGNRWRAHLSPSQTGTWYYFASFASGNNVAVQMDPEAGTFTSFTAPMEPSKSARPTSCDPTSEPAGSYSTSANTCRGSKGTVVLPQGRRRQSREPAGLRRLRRHAEFPQLRAPLERLRRFRRRPDLEEQQGPEPDRCPQLSRQQGDQLGLLLDDERQRRR